MKSYMSVAGPYTVNSSIRRSPRSGLTDSLVDVALDPEHSGPVRHWRGDGINRFQCV